MLYITHKIQKIKKWYSQHENENKNPTSTKKIKKEQCRRK